MGKHCLRTLALCCVLISGISLARAKDNPGRNWIAKIYVAQGKAWVAKTSDVKIVQALSKGDSIYCYPGNSIKVDKSSRVVVLHRFTKSRQELTGSGEAFSKIQIEFSIAQRRVIEAVRALDASISKGTPNPLFDFPPEGAVLPISEFVIHGKKGIQPVTTSIVSEGSGKQMSTISFTLLPESRVSIDQLALAKIQREDNRVACWIEATLTRIELLSASEERILKFRLSQIPLEVDLELRSFLRAAVFLDAGCSWLSRKELSTLSTDIVSSSFE